MQQNTCGFVALVLIIAISSYIGYFVGFDKGLSAGLTVNDSEMSWDCTFSRITEFAMCDGRKK